MDVDSQQEMDMRGIKRKRTQIELPGFKSMSPLSLAQQVVRDIRERCDKSIITLITGVKSGVALMAEKKFALID